MRVLGNAADAYALGQTQIAVGDGRTVRLADIAQVRDLYAEQRSRAAVDGRQVVSFDFQRAKGASDVTVFDDAVKKLRGAREAQSRRSSSSCARPASNTPRSSIRARSTR